MNAIITTPDKDIIGIGLSAQREDAQGETALIKVTVDANGGFYYIGTNDRDTYTLYSVDTVPADLQTVKYKYDGTTFTPA